MADIAFRSARQLAAMVRKKQVGCLELLDHYIARAERLDPKINAVVTRDFDRARKRAPREKRYSLDNKGKYAGARMAPAS